MAVSMQEQIRCVERELQYRRRVYQRRVEAGKMTRMLAAREITAMQAVLKTLQEKEEKERPI